MTTKQSAAPLSVEWWTARRLAALNDDRARLNREPLTADEAVELYRKFCRLARAFYRRYR